MQQRWTFGVWLALGVWPALGGCAGAHAVGSPPPALWTTGVAPTHVTHVARDFDGDGFVDPADRCPESAGVAPYGCPDPDSDGDGYVDSKDACRDAPGVEPDGCPIPDTDADKILDPDDRCPLAAETVNGFEDVEGCPDEIPSDLASLTGTIRGVKFDLDKDTLRPSSRAALDRAVAILTKYPDVRIEVSGHTDRTGDSSYLRSSPSRRRPESVKRYLVEHGILAERVKTRFAGPDEPIDTNKTAAGRAKNRRIEFTILVQ